MWSAKPRNPAPVTNPDRGAHYLKKSPSPTGAKTPPGGHATAEEFLQKKALINSHQQVQNLHLYANVTFNVLDLQFRTLLHVFTAKISIKP